MFPLKSYIPLKHFPAGVWLLILANLFIYLYFLFNYHPLLFADHGFVPVKLSLPSEYVGLNEKVFPFFSYMFIHGSFIHVFVNMYFLYVFGRNVEDYVGTFRFIVLYLFCGVIAVIFEALMSPDLKYPIIGSSGAVAGIIGFYLIFYPYSKIKTLIFLVVYVSIKNIPVIIIMLLFFIFQVSLWLGTHVFDINYYIDLLQYYLKIDNITINISNTAFWTHFGGLIAGLLLGLIIRFLSHEKKDRDKEVESL